jgi:hypothetical protein
VSKVLTLEKLNLGAKEELRIKDQRIKRIIKMCNDMIIKRDRGSLNPGWIPAPELI